MSYLLSPQNLPLIPSLIRRGRGRSNLEEREKTNIIGRRLTQKKRF